MNGTSEPNASNSEQRFTLADAELVGFFTASVGVRAQQYDACGGTAFDVHEAHTSKLKAMRWLAPGSPASAMVVRDRVASSLLELPRATLEVLTAVYAPHGWPLVVASALSTPWGGGSLTELAATLPLASRAAGGGNAVSVVEWLAVRIERIGRIELDRNRREAEVAFGKMVAEWRSAAETLRMAALEEYEVVRRARVAAEVASYRAVRDNRRRKSEAMLAEELGMSRRIARARLERRMGRKVAA